MAEAVVERPKGLRGKALALWRRSTAVELALAGHSYDEIAAACGYANRGTAWRTVTEALREQGVDQVSRLRRLELARLDRLQAAHWDGAVGGDVKAADRVLKVMAMRVRLLGLDRDTSERAMRDIVIVPEDRMAETLMQAVLERDGPDRPRGEDEGRVLHGYEKGNQEGNFVAPLAVP
jgi:hypothetical protein